MGERLPVKNCVRLPYKKVIELPSKKDVKLHNKNADLLLKKAHLLP
jgi:hypothetical protein